MSSRGACTVTHESLYSLVNPALPAFHLYLGSWSTIVRASWFDQNFSEGYLIDGVLAGEIALPAGAVPEPFIDADDIADVVVAALTDERHANKLYEVTGPRALTFAEAAAEIAAATGRAIRYAQISAQDFAAGMRQAGVPDDVVALLYELFRRHDHASPQSPPMRGPQPGSSQWYLPV